MFWSKIKPAFWDRNDPRLELLNYRRLWKTTFISAVAVALAPLIFLAGINFYQFSKQYDLQQEAIGHHMMRLLATTKVQVAYFLDERKAALNYASLDNTYDQLSDPEQLQSVFSKLRTAFGGFVDLGVINSDGIQQTYIGPYSLEGDDYSNEEWYEEVLIRGIYISDVFMGHRNFPHFVIAVRHETINEKPYILRATIDTEQLNALLRVSEPQASGDIFLVNDQGVLQTPSKLFGGVLFRFDPYEEADLTRTGVFEIDHQQGQALKITADKINGTPFRLVVVDQSGQYLVKWDLLRINVIVLILLSVGAIVIVIWWGSTMLVNKIFEADLRRAAVLHEVEYTNKLASIGRLAAGVAHEINNPVAIINEKVGLMGDLLEVNPDRLDPEKFKKQLKVIRTSVKRVSDITHRLLGFARHLPVKSESIHLEELLQSVLAFLEREAEYRNVTIDLKISEETHCIESDTGQLQQVFLNIINNALNAVHDGGFIEITVEPDKADFVVIRIKDNGIGIPKENLDSIFEPFFSTKGDRGTGLGLSITYGIVQKLGGKIEVESETGVGTVFHVFLPYKAPAGATCEIQL